MTQSAGRSVEVVFFDVDMRRGGGVAGSVIPGGVRGLAAGGGEWLRLLAAIAIDGHGFDSELPRLQVSLGNIVDGGVVGQVDGFGDGSGDEGLSGGHHLDVSHVMNRSSALGRLEGAIEDGEVLVFYVGRAFDGSG